MSHKRKPLIKPSLNYMETSHSSPYNYFSFSPDSIWCAALSVSSPLRFYVSSSRLSIQFGLLNVISNNQSSHFRTQLQADKGTAERHREIASHVLMLLCSSILTLSHFVCVIIYPHTFIIMSASCPILLSRNSALIL